MTDYTDFDDILIAKVAGGATSFTDLRGGPLELLGNTIAGADRNGNPQGWRVIDRRLQALRKAGRLTFDRKNGWRVA